MNDSFFLDSNVLLYSIDDKSSSNKKAVALGLLKQVGLVSPQVVFECINVCIRKLGLSKTETLAHISFIRSATILQAEEENVIDTSLKVFIKYNLQPYDSKIVASALVAGCHILYSEDMQHGLVIENSLTIVNPFLSV